MSPLTSFGPPLRFEERSASPRLSQLPFQESPNIGNNRFH